MLETLVEETLLRAGLDFDTDEYRGQLLVVVGKDEEVFTRLLAPGTAEQNQRSLALLRAELGL